MSKYTEETTKYGDNIVHLTCLTAEECKSIDGVFTSVHCFPVRDGKILVTINSRGVDIIGGHIEKGETRYMAMIREGLEEGCVLLNNLKLIGAIRVDNRDSPAAIKKGYPMIGYQTFFSCVDFDELPFIQKHECTDRKYVDPKDLPKIHHNWLRTHDEILRELKLDDLQ